MYIRGTSSTTLSHQLKSFLLICLQTLGFAKVHNSSVLDHLRSLEGKTAGVAYRRAFVLPPSSAHSYTSPCVDASQLLC